MKTKIFVMTHKEFNPPLDEMYVPMQVGSSLNSDLGYLRDDSGENISDLNPYFGELTGYFWLWKNLQDVDYIGVCHYRRFFGIDGKLLSESDIDEMLKEYDIVTSNIVETSEKNYKDDFSSAHNIKDLDLLRNAIATLYPGDLVAFDAALEENTHTYGNLLITKKAIFDEYCEWLFDIFTWMMDKVDFTGYDAYHMRLFGFLSENLIRVFARSRFYTCIPGRVYISGEKVETSQLKLALFQLLKEGNILGAKEMLNTMLKLRPDVLLPLSDLSGELNMIAKIVISLDSNIEDDFLALITSCNSYEEMIDKYKMIDK